MKTYCVPEGGSKFDVIVKILYEMQEDADYPFNERIEYLVHDVNRLYNDYKYYLDNWEATGLRKKYEN